MPIACHYESKPEKKWRMVARVQKVEGHDGGRPLPNEHRPQCGTQGKSRCHSGRRPGVQDEEKEQGASGTAPSAGVRKSTCFWCFHNKRAPMVTAVKGLNAPSPQQCPRAQGHASGAWAPEELAAMREAYASILPQLPKRTPESPRSLPVPSFPVTNSKRSVTGTCSSLSKQNRSHLGALPTILKVAALPTSSLSTAPLVAYRHLVALCCRASGDQL